MATASPSLPRRSHLFAILHQRGTGGELSGRHNLAHLNYLRLPDRYHGSRLVGHPPSDRLNNTRAVSNGQRCANDKEIGHVGLDTVSQPPPTGTFPAFRAWLAHRVCLHCYSPLLYQGQMIDVLRHERHIDIILRCPLERSESSSASDTWVGCRATRDTVHRF